jgi:hypothetical protein
MMQNPAMNEKNLESGRQENGIRFALAALRSPQRPKRHMLRLRNGLGRTMRGIESI